MLHGYLMELALPILSGADFDYLKRIILITQHRSGTNWMDRRIRVSFGIEAPRSTQQKLPIVNHTVVWIEFP